MRYGDTVIQARDNGNGAYRVLVNTSKGQPLPAGAKLSNCGALLLVHDELVAGPSAKGDAIKLACELARSYEKQGHTVSLMLPG